MSVITLTFGDNAENHVGMQKIGRDAAAGLTLDDLTVIRRKVDDMGLKTELIDLSYGDKDGDKDGDLVDAQLLVVRGGVQHFAPECTADELLALEWDAKARMYGRVVNKHARHNLCFSDFSQEPNYEQGRGRVYNFDAVGGLTQLRTAVGNLLPDKLTDLQCEGNLYFDPQKCYIGFHGDSERKIVVGARLNRDCDSFPLFFQWYERGTTSSGISSREKAPVGDVIRVDLRHGDVYFMSEKAVGQDWKSGSHLTLRHAAGERSLPNKSVVAQKRKLN